MKVLVRKGDVLPRITSGPFELAARKLAFSPHLRLPRPDRGFTKGFPEIQQIDPAAVPEIPLWIREAVHFCLRIELRMPGGKRPLFQSEPLAPNREFRRQANAQGQELLRCELQGLAVQVAKIQWVVQRAPRIEPEL